MNSEGLIKLLKPAPLLTDGKGQKLETRIEAATQMAAVLLKGKEDKEQLFQNAAALVDLTQEAFSELRRILLDDDPSSVQLYEWVEAEKRKSRYNILRESQNGNSRTPEPS